MNNINDMFRVGIVASTHGIKGELKVFPTTDDKQRFNYLKKVFLVSKNESLEVQVAGVKYFKNMVIIKFKEFNNINEVEKYKGADLFVTRENAVPLEEGEHYIADLLGIDVYTEEQVLLGKVKEVLKTGANDVYVVDDGTGNEILLPVIPECVKNINIEKGVITVHIMEGLIE